MMCGMYGQPHRKSSDRIRFKKYQRRRYREPPCRLIIKLAQPAQRVPIDLFIILAISTCYSKNKSENNTNNSKINRSIGTRCAMDLFILCVTSMTYHEMSPTNNSNYFLALTPSWRAPARVDIRDGQDGHRGAPACGGNTRCRLGEAGCSHDTPQEVGALINDGLTPS